MELLVSLLDPSDLDIYQKSGVTGIILAEKQFSLASPKHFSKNEIKAITALASSKQLAVYLLVNRMMFDSDLRALKDWLSLLKEIKVTGIYFADLAVLTLAQKLEMTELLIYAPGAPLVNSFDAQVFLDTGIKAVELANEITLDEKLKIAQILPRQVATILHGHLIMSTSKRPLLSNYFSEIKKDYSVVDNYQLSLIEATRDRKMPIYENEHGTIIYQAEVLQSFQEINLLLEAGLEIFRIDAMFLSKSDLMLALKYYQKALSGEIIQLSEIKSQFEKELGHGYYYQASNLVK